MFKAGDAVKIKIAPDDSYGVVIDPLTYGSPYYKVKITSPGIELNYIRTYHQRALEKVEQRKKTIPLPLPG